jgi:hypothetical protein
VSEDQFRCVRVIPGDRPIKDRKIAVPREDIRINSGVRQQQPQNIRVAVRRCDAKRGFPIQVDRIYVDPMVDAFEQQRKVIRLRGRCKCNCVPICLTVLFSQKVKKCVTMETRGDFKK